MFDIFTEDARAAIVAAQAEAHERADAHLGCEHLLLGLLRQGTGRAAVVLGAHSVTLAGAHAALDDLTGRPPPVTPADALASIGVDLDAVAARLEATFGPEAMAPAPTPFDAGAKEALQTAVTEAERLGQAHVGTEHALLGLLAVPDTTATAILARLGADVVAVAGDAAQPGGA